MAKVDRGVRVQQLAETDKPFWTQGLVVAGMDEVGRGPLVGNVVVACVVMPEAPLIEWVDDSKKLSESRREKVYQQILDVALHIGIGQASPEKIDRINILQATKQAMRQAADQVPADVYLVDAVTNLGLKGVEVPIIRGDATSYSIAAASIVAKVVRDRQMIQLDQLYPQYGFARNKGYGTAEHIAALKELGPCPYHRKSFIKNFWP